MYEKVDGSFISLFLFNGELIVASRGSFTSHHVGWAKEILRDRGVFAKPKELFWGDLTYCFELIWPENRVVVDYGDKKDLVLLSISNGYKELSHDELFCLSKYFEVVKKYDGIEDFSTLKELNEYNREGYVIKFTNGDRIKIKFSDYLNLHRLCTDVTNIRVYEALVAGTLDKWIEGLPDEFYKKIRDCANEFTDKFGDIIKNCDDIFMAIGRIDNRKKFAEQVLSTPKEYHSILFSYKDHKPITDLVWKQVKPKESVKL